MRYTFVTSHISGVHTSVGVPIWQQNGSTLVPLYSCCFSPVRGGTELELGMNHGANDPEVLARQRLGPLQVVLAQGHADVGHGLVLDAVAGRDHVPPVDEHAAALALAHADEGLPGEGAESGRLAVEDAAVGRGAVLLAGAAAHGVVDDLAVGLVEGVVAVLKRVEGRDDNGLCGCTFLKIMRCRAP